LKILTILGTRPEIIRLSRIIPALDGLCRHIVVHTGQNFDPNLSDVFFRELGLRTPDYHLNLADISSSFGEQVGEILRFAESVMLRERPDRVLVLGDTNSGLSMIIAKRLGIPTYHMEAGNRCFDDRVPEEVNRRIIDQCSDVLLPYTERSRQNLLREGFPLQRILVTGNPIHEVINYYAGQIGSSQALAHLQLERQGYFLVTMHRAENVDLEIRLRSLTTALEQVQREYGLPVICSLHPHTRLRMENFGLQVGNGKVQFLEPMGLFDFIALEQQALCVLSDSGTVQEECCIFRVPAVTVRDTTERPETIECGSNILSGVEPDAVLSCVKVALQQAGKWQPPAEYLAENVTRTVVKVLLGGTIRPLC
jgi:UDP-N-acetylglucosamine 2-epimerase (non-hydrolysing)